MATNELGNATLDAKTVVTTLPTSAFVDDGHGGWALSGAAFAEKGVALYDYQGGMWSGPLSGNISTEVDGTEGAEQPANWALSLRAKVGAAADQVLWYLKYGAEGRGVYLRTVAREGGGIDLSLEWSLGAEYTPYVNVILENVDTTAMRHYVVAVSQADGIRLFVDGEEKWKASSITCYRKNDAGELTTMSRTPCDKSYKSLWLGCVKGMTSVGTGDWTTVYDDVRFYSTNVADDSVPTADEIAALTETVKAERVLPPMPEARFAVTFADRTLADSAGVIANQVGADTLARSAFRKNDRGGYTLDAARLPAGQKGVCLYEQRTTWKEGEIMQLFGGGTEDCRTFAVSLVAKIAPVDDAAVFFLHYGNAGVGLVLYTRTNETGGTDLALTWQGSADRYAYPNVLATNIDTEDYHHYVLTCARQGGNSTFAIRLWIDNRPVDLFKHGPLTRYAADNSREETSLVNPASKGFSGLYLAAARDANLSCTSPNGTRFGDVRLFVGEDFTDGYGPCAIDPEGIDVLCRTLMPYADAPRTGSLLIIR